MEKDKIDNFGCKLFNELTELIIKIHQNPKNEDLKNKREMIDKVCSAYCIEFGYNPSSSVKHSKMLYDENGKRYTGVLLSHRQAEQMYSVIMQLEKECKSFSGGSISLVGNGIAYNVSDVYLVFAIN